MTVVGPPFPPWSPLEMLIQIDASGIRNISKIHRERRSWRFFGSVEYADKICKSTTDSEWSIAYWLLTWLTEWLTIQFGYTKEFYTNCSVCTNNRSSSSGVMAAALIYSNTLLEFVYQLSNTWRNLTCVPKKLWMFQCICGIEACTTVKLGNEDELIITNMVISTQTSNKGYN